MKELKDMDWEELVEYNTLRIHATLLEEGGKGMRIAVWQAMDMALRWREEKDGGTDR